MNEIDRLNEELERETARGDALAARVRELEAELEKARARGEPERATSSVDIAAKSAAINEGFLRLAETIDERARALSDAMLDGNEKVEACLRELGAAIDDRKRPVDARSEIEPAGAHAVETGDDSERECPVCGEVETCDARKHAGEKETP